MKYQMSGEVSFRIVVEANSEDEVLKLLKQIKNKEIQIEFIRNSIDGTMSGNIEGAVIDFEPVHSSYPLSFVAT